MARAVRDRLKVVGVLSTTPLDLNDLLHPLVYLSEPEICLGSDPMHLGRRGGLNV
jgi:hypothetical protein